MLVLVDGSVGMIVGSVVSKNLEGPDRSFAAFILGYLAIFVGWYWWALRSDDPISAVVFVVPLFLVELLDDCDV